MTIASSPRTLTAYHMTLEGIGRKTRAAPGRGPSQDELLHMLSAPGLAPVEARKLRNRLSALASRQKTQNHINHLTDLCRSLQTELLTMLDSVSEIGTKRRLEVLLATPLSAASPSTAFSDHHVRGKSTTVETTTAATTRFNVTKRTDSFFEPAVF